MNRIKKNDKVIVISGKYKNVEGVVLKVFPKLNKAIVEGINKVKRHKKNEDPKLRIVEKEMPICLSNISLINKKKEKTKVSYEKKEKTKIRVNRKTKEKII